MKNNPWPTMLVLSALMLVNRSSYAYEKQADGVLFEIKKEKETDPRWLKIQICAEDIVRVVATPGESFSSRPSLMVEKTKWGPTPWTVNEKGDWVDISTSRLTMRVQQKSGAVSF
jgi:alpha-D-xyloside xylohydrolase